MKSSLCEMARFFRHIYFIRMIYVPRHPCLHHWRPLLSGLITRPLDTAIKTRYDRNAYTCAGAAPIATHDRSLIASSFPGRLIRLIAVEPTIIGQKAQRDLCGPTRPPVRGLTRTEARFVIVSRRRMDFHCSPTSPGRYALSKGTKVSASRNPESRGTWMWDDEMVWQAAGLRCFSHLRVPSSCSALSLICSYPCKCRSVLPRYEIAPAASVVLNYWITIASAHITAAQ